MKYILRRYSGIWLFLANIAFFCLMAWLLPIMFEDNDDTTMVWIANGIYSGTPDCHLVFINAIFGQILVWLYSWISGVEWYVVSFALLHIIAMSVVVSYCIKKIRSRAIMWSTIVLLYSLWTWIIIRFQFTTTAAITAFAATLLLLDRRYLWGGILLVLASMVRFSSAGLVGLIMAPAFLYIYRFQWRKNWLPLAFVLICVLFVRKADGLFYQTSEWKEFVAFNNARGKINDNPNCWSVYDHLPEGVDHIDYCLLAGFFADPKIIPIPKLESIVDEITHPSLKQALYNAIFRMIKPNIWWLIVLLIPFVLSLCRDRRLDWSRLWIIIPYCLWFCVLCLISFSGSVKNRVFISSLLPMVMYAVAAMDSMSRENKWKRYSSVVLILSVSVIGFIIPSISRSEGIARQRVVIEEQMQLVEASSGYQIVPSGADYSVQLYPPFSLSNVIEPRKFINSYCMMMSPLNDTFQSHLDLVNNDLVLFAKKPYDTLELNRAILKNYNIQIDTLHVAETANYELIKFIEASCQ